MLGRRQRGPGEPMMGAPGLARHNTQYAIQTSKNQNKIGVCVRELAVIKLDRQHEVSILIETFH